MGALIAPSLLAAKIDTSDLQPIIGDVVPIGRAERAVRLAKAQELMRRRGIGAVPIEPGASLVYFTGVRCARSNMRARSR